MGTEGWFHHSFCPPIYFQCKITMQNVHVTTNDELLEHPELKACAFVNQSKIPSKVYVIMPPSLVDEVLLNKIQRDAQ